MKTEAKLSIEIQYGSPALEKTLAKTVSATLLKKWVKQSCKHSGLITLRFVNTAEGKKLNAAFRNKDKATNVLTFPYELSKKELMADIVFCLPVIQKEVKEQQKTLKAHLAHLVIHGCLHAQGHDHEIERDALRMEKQEIKILKDLGFANPYLPLAI
jgi:probable rRNA maturation factor